MKAQQGSVVLMVVLLMSILLVLCSSMWRTTAYVIDIVVKKQEYMQNKWATRGLLNCGIIACQKDFAAVHKRVSQQGGNISIPLRSYTLSLPQLKNYTPTLVFAVQGDDALQVTAELRAGDHAVCAQSCVVEKPL